MKLVPHLTVGPFTVAAQVLPSDSPILFDAGDIMISLKSRAIPLADGRTIVAVEPVTHPTPWEIEIAKLNQVITNLQKQSANRGEGNGKKGLLQKIFGLR